MDDTYQNPNTDYNSQNNQQGGYPQGGYQQGGYQQGGYQQGYQNSGYQQGYQQGGYQQGGYQPGGYQPGGYQPGGQQYGAYQPGQYPPPGGNAYPPSSNMVWAILTTLFCCLPFGIVSIVYASKVDGLWASGQFAAAYDSANKARNWAIWSAVIGLVCLVGTFVAGLAGVGIFAEMMRELR